MVHLYHTVRCRIPPTHEPCKNVHISWLTYALCMLYTRLFWMHVRSVGKEFISTIDLEEHLDMGWYKREDLHF